MEGLPRLVGNQFYGLSASGEVLPLDPGDFQTVAEARIDALLAPSTDINPTILPGSGLRGRSQPDFPARLRGATPTRSAENGGPGGNRP